MIVGEKSMEVIRRQNIYELVANDIKDRIKSGELKPGDKLETVEQLAKSYGVGRPSIREALSTLKGMGLIEMRHGEGTFVREYDYSNFTFPQNTLLLLDHKELMDLFEVRKIMESNTVSLAAKNRSVEDLEKIEAALQKMQAGEGNEAVVIEADVEFHLAIAEATHNSFLIKLMHHISDTLFSTMKESRSFWLRSEDQTLKRLYQEHEAIYVAILKQDHVLAENIMLSHLTKVEEGLKSIKNSQV